MNRFQLTCILAPVLLLNACAKSLQPGNYADHISTRWLAADRFVVDYRGYPASAEERVIDLVLLRSAEIALQNGFNYFIVVDDSESASATNGALQTIATELTISNGRRYRPATPGTTNTIVGFARKPKGFAFVALFVKASLRAKYGLDQAAASI
jgi:hypothetical protein